MALRPSSVPLHVPLPSPLASSLPEVPDPESDRARVASSTVSRLLATSVTDPSFGFATAFALVAELLDFAAACRLDYATALVAEQEDFECLAAAVPHFASMLLASEGDPDAQDFPTRRSYVEAITAFLHGSLHDEIWLRRPPGFTGSFPAGTQWSLRRPVYGLRQVGGPYPELVGCLITLGVGLVLGGRGLVVLTGHVDAFWVDDSATQRSSQGYTFSLGSGSVSWRSTCSSSVLSSSCEAEIYARAMVAQELR
ncbi:unnamed protein product [Closterium sp. NIES-53]